MKSINVLKILIEQEEKKTKIVNEKDTARIVKDKINKFEDAYIIPELLKLGFNEDDVYEAERRIYDIIKAEARETISKNERVDLYRLGADYLNEAKVSEKKKVAKKFIDIVIRNNEYSEKAEKYKEQFIVPMLEKLAKEKVITYDKVATDDKAKAETEKIDKLMDKFVDDSLLTSILFPLLQVVFSDEYCESFGFLYTDNMEEKQKFAKVFYNFIKENINSIDFKKLDETNFGEYTGAKVNITNELDLMAYNNLKEIFIDNVNFIGYMGFSKKR